MAAHRGGSDLPQSTSQSGDSDYGRRRPYDQREERPMKLPVFIFAVTAVVALAALSSGRWFEDRTKAAGIVHRHSNRVFQNQYANIMAGYTALGASAAVADYDNDGLDDVYLTDS